MADIAALERQLAELQTRDAELETRFNQTQPQVEAARARLREAEQRLADLDKQFPRSVTFNDITRARQAAEANPSDAAAQQRLQDLRSQFASQRQQRTEFLAEAQAQFNTAQQEFRAAVAPQSELSFESEQLANEIAQVQQQIESSRRQGPGTVSAGDVVADDQAAFAQGANTQNPEPVQVDGRISAATNAVLFEPDVDSNVSIDAAIRKQQQLQGLPSVSVAQGTGNVPTDAFGFDESQLSPTRNSNIAGTAARPDDASGFTDLGTVTVTAQTNAVQTAVDSKFDTKILPQPNILDKFASYTYSISIYIMGPEQYRNLITQKQRQIPDGTLLIQSGGIAQGQRNQQFPLDYYIDDVEVKSVMPGKGTGAAHNVTQMTFRIIEPNGITLIKNLRRASQVYVQQTGSSKNPKTNNYAAQNYLMVIRFYGYDELGNLVRPDTVADVAGTSDRLAIVEKFIPFQFTSIKFRVANRLTEYECEAVAPQNTVGTGQGRGVIPFNIQLTASTLQGLLAGNQVSTASSPPKTTAKNANTATSLAEALNAFQKKLVEDGVYTLADRYEIVLVEPELQNAGIVPPGTSSKRTTPMTKAETAAQAKDGQAQSVDSRSKTVSAVAGTSITQFIDLAVRSSDYIYKQQTKIKQRDRDGKETEIPQGTAAESFGWYRVGVEVAPISDTLDPKRNDYAYNIKYIINMYGITDMNSEYFPLGKYRGEHKKYSYWFTGENTSILNFEQDFNFLFYTPATGGSIGNGNNTSETAKRIASPNSGQTNQGTEGEFNEPAANAADFLYSVGDQAQIKMEIIGDPAWIQQGELWRGLAEQFSYGPFLADGTINYDAREAVFLVSFNQSEDYDINTGLMKVK
jgi:hypothetical protein